MNYTITEQHISCQWSFSIPPENLNVFKGIEIRDLVLLVQNLGGALFLIKLQAYY